MFSEKWPDQILLKKNFLLRGFILKRCSNYRLHKNHAITKSRDILGIKIKTNLSNSEKLWVALYQCQETNR